MGDFIVFGRRSVTVAIACGSGAPAAPSCCRLAKRPDLLEDRIQSLVNDLVDKIAERIQLLGGVSIAMAHDLAGTTSIPRPPKGREEVPVYISLLLHAQDSVTSRRAGKDALGQ